jgi:hypothetical protein
MSIPTLESDIGLRESSLELNHVLQFARSARSCSETKLCIQSSRSPGSSNATNLLEDQILHMPMIHHQHHHPLLFSPNEASPAPNRQSEELQFTTAVDHGNDPSERRAHVGNAHMEHQANYRMPVPPLQQTILPLYSADGIELTSQRQLQQYLFTQATANNRVNDTNDLLRHALSRQNQYAGLRMPLPLLQRTFAFTSDFEGVEPIQQRQLYHSLLSSQRPSTSDFEDAELIQQRQIEHFILSQANASNNVSNTTSGLLLHALESPNQDAPYNQFLPNELNKIIHSSSLIPVQQVQQQNYQVNNFASTASPSHVILNAQVGLLRGTSASMERPPAAPLQWSAPRLPTAGLTSANNFIATSSRNRTEVAVQFTPLIRSDVGEAKTASEKRNTTSILIALGNRTRTTAEPYLDASDMAQDLGSRPPIRGGVVNRFPEKLHQMLTAVEAEGESQIISFYSHGRAFAIHDGARFEAEILPKFIPEQGKLISFVRQLNLYGFIRINSGPDSGGYYHELFLKGQPCLSHFMRRVGAAPKNTGGKKKKDKSAQSRRHQPNFYDMKRVLPA